MRQLIAYRRIALAPGASSEVEFEITADMLMLYDAQGQGYSPKGICDLAVGMDANAPFSLSVDCER